MSEIVENTRYKDIEGRDIRVGYYYPTSQYYVTTNYSTTYSTTTYRATLEAIKEVLQALEITDIQESELQAFKDNIETLQSIYYTWDSTGSFIYSIQFNDWADYLLILDANKQKLYVTNSTIIFDLQVEESAEIVRTPILVSFFEKTLGIAIPKKIMLAVYKLLVSYYNPKLILTDIAIYKEFYNSHACTNQIAERTEEEIQKKAKIYYNNIFKIANYAKNNPIVYTCTQNPLNLSNPPINIANIVKLDNITNTIILEQPLTDETLENCNIRVGSKIGISGSTAETSSYIYTSDGDYTIESITGNKEIKVQESIPAAYDYPYYKLYVEAKKYTISSISRETNTITVVETPTDLLAGDTITISNGNIESGYDTIVVDGRYTVQSINGNTITVQELVPTTFAYSTNPSLSKEVYISDIASYDSTNNTLTLLNNLPYNLNSTPVIVYNNSIDFNTRLTDIAKIAEQGSNIVRLTNSISLILPSYPQLQYLQPSEDILVSIVHSEYTDELPTGNFIVSNFNEAYQYLAIPKVKIKGIQTEVPVATLPTTDTDSIEKNKGIQANMYKEVPDTMWIPVEERGSTDEYQKITCLGIFKEVYPET